MNYECHITVEREDGPVTAGVAGKPVMLIVQGLTHAPVYVGVEA